jgi:hypothetical protein
MVWSAGAWPSDQTLRYDHTTLTISRVPYLDFSNTTWKTKSYPVRNISNLQFAVYAYAKNSSIYGLHFNANGKRHKTLPSLQAPEAQEILKALQSLGVDVALDDKLQEKVDVALKKRGNPLSIGVYAPSNSNSL